MADEARDIEDEADYIRRWEQLPRYKRKWLIEKSPEELKLLDQSIEMQRKLRIAGDLKADWLLDKSDEELKLLDGAIAMQRKMEVAGSFRTSLVVFCGAIVAIGMAVEYGGTVLRAIARKFGAIP